MPEDIQDNLLSPALASVCRLLQQDDVEGMIIGGLAASLPRRVLPDGCLRRPPGPHGGPPTDRGHRRRRRHRRRAQGAAAVRP